MLLKHKNIKYVILFLRQVENLNEELNFNFNGWNGKTISALYFVKATGLQKYGVYLLKMITVVWGVWLQVSCILSDLQARL